MRAFEKAHVENPLVVATDGQEALDYIFGIVAHEGRDACELPSLTLLDLKLPKVSGLEVLRRIRAKGDTRRMPVVILTSSLDDQDLAVAYDLGVNSYIRKPVDFNQFVQAIEQLRLDWLILNEPPPKMKWGIYERDLTCSSS
jgi:two-component system response regulator